MYTILHVISISCIKKRFYLYSFLSVRMETIISKKYTELEHTLNTFIEEAMILFSIDTNCKFDSFINEKVATLNKWISDRKLEHIKSNEIEISQPDIKEPVEDTKKQIPSFMLPTISFLASANVTPRIYSEHHTDQSNNRMHSIDMNHSIYRGRRDRSQSTDRNRRERSQSTDTKHSDPCVIPKQNEPCVIPKQNEPCVIPKQNEPCVISK
jgi:hypothetical protein